MTTENGFIATERKIAFAPKGGHSHNGQNSSPVELAQRQVKLENLDGSVISFIENTSPAITAGISIPDLHFTTDTLAPGAVQQGSSTWTSSAIVIATQVSLNAASTITLQFYTSDSYSVREFEAVNAQDGYDFTGTWAHRDATGGQQVFWRVTNTGGVDVQASITLISGTLGTNDSVPHVDSIGLFGSNDAPATGPVTFATGTGVAIIRSGNTFTWTTAPYGQPIGPPPPIPEPQNLHVTTGLDNGIPYADVSWDMDPSLAGSDKVLQYYAKLVKVGFGTVQTHIGPETSWHIEPLDPDTDYTVEIQAQSSAGQLSIFAGPVSFHTPKDTTIPKAPINVIAGFSFKVVTISWDDDPTNTAKIDHYQVRIDTNNPISNVSPNYMYHGNVKGQVDVFNNLVDGTTYYVQVSAISTSGIEGPWSTIVSGTSGTLNSIDFSDITLTTANLDLVIGGDNKALNSSFEADTNGDGLADSFTLFGTTSAAVLDNTIFYHGKFSQKFHVGANSSTAGIEQVSIGPITPGLKYTFTWLVYPAIDSQWGFHITGVDVADSPYQAMTANVWKRVKYTATATASSFDVALRTTNANFDVRVDGFMVQEGDTATAYVPKADEILPFTVYGDMLAQETIDSTRIMNQAIENAKVATNAIAAANIQAGSVISSKIPADTINTTHIQDAAITTAKIGAAQITNALIANAAIGTANIINASITNALIGSAAIATANIQDAAITNAKIGNAAIETANIAAAAITSATIANAAIQTVHIQDAAITNAKIGALAVGTANIQDTAISNAKIATLAVGTANIQDAAITNAKIGALAVNTANIANAAIGTAKIADASITDAKISDLTVDKITSGSITSQIFTIGSGGVIRGDYLVSTGNHSYFLIDSAGIHFFKNGTAAFTGGTTTANLDITSGNAYFSGTVAASTISGSAITGSTLNINGRFTVASNGDVGISTNAILLDNDHVFKSADAAANSEMFRIVRSISGTSVLNTTVAFGYAAHDLSYPRFYWDYTINVMKIIGHTAGAGQDAGLMITSDDGSPVWLDANIEFGESYSGGFYPNNGAGVMDTNWGFQVAHGAASDLSQVTVNVIFNGNTSGHRFQVLDSNAGFAAVQYVDNSGVWHSSSKKLKDNIIDVQNGLDAIKLLRPVKYNRIKSDKTVLGLIAEEVNAVLPEAVGHDTNGNPDAINYASITAALIKAVQELKAELDHVKSMLH